MVVMPILYVVGLKMRRVMFPISWITQARLAEVATVVDENVNGVRVVKAFAQEEAEVNRLADAAEGVAWAYVKDAEIRGVWSPWVQNLPQLGLALVLFFGGWMVLQGHLGVGAILAFNAYLLMMQAPFMMLGQLVMMGQRAKASAERIFEILDESPEVIERPGAVDLIDARGDVDFSHVRFTYANGARDPRGLRRAPRRRRDRRHRRAHRLGQVHGRAPADALLRRHRRRGRGRRPRRARPVTLSSLRANVGVVIDEPFLFSVSIRDNIAYGRPDATDEQVEAAARAARRPRVHRRAPRGLRHGHRRARLHPVGGPAPARRHRADPAGQPAGADPRRRDQRDRRARRGRDLRGPSRAAARPHDHRHRPPRLDHRPGRARHPARRGPGRRRPAPTRSSLATRRCTRRSSPRPPTRGRLMAWGGGWGGGGTWCRRALGVQRPTACPSAASRASSWTRPPSSWPPSRRAKRPTLAFTPAPQRQGDADGSPWPASSARYPASSVAAARLLVVAISLVLQAGPKLTEYAINHGMIVGHRSLTVIAVCGGLYLVLALLERRSAARRGST